jgi:hypothetical protein
MVRLSGSVRKPGSQFKEDVMPRSLSLIAACLLALVFCSPGRGQDSHSLGDTARESQKDKDGRPPAKVFTNEDMHPVSEGISAALGAPKHDADKQGSDGHDVDNHSGNRSNDGSLEKLQELLNQLASMDRAMLVKNVLGSTPPNFPGLVKWEEELFVAKQTFVSQSRDALQKEKQLEDSVEDMKGAPDPNDPRLKTVVAKLQEIMEETQQANAAFQAVITEGKNLVAQHGHEQHDRR